MITETNCRSEEGVTVGLIDAIISISRILANRNLSSKVVTEALKDLREDGDLNLIVKG